MQSCKHWFEIPGSAWEREREREPSTSVLTLSAAEYALIVVTGDKRSVIATSAVDGMADALRGRIASMEAILLALCRRLGREHVRSAVKPLVAVKDRKDKMVQVCFSDGNSDPEGALTVLLQRT